MTGLAAGLRACNGGLVHRQHPVSSTERCSHPKPSLLGTDCSRRNSISKFAGEKLASAFLPNSSLRLWAVALPGPGCWAPRRKPPPTPTPSRQRRRPRWRCAWGGHARLSRPAPARVPPADPGPQGRQTPAAAAPPAAAWR